MTAVLVYVRPNGAHLFTDGAMSSPDGSTVALKQKVQVAAHQSAAYVARGPDVFSGLVSVLVSQAQGDFDDLAGSFAGMCQQSHAHMLRTSQLGRGLPGNPHMVDAVLVGFSPTLGFVAYLVASYPQDGHPAWSLRPLAASSVLAYASPMNDAVEAGVKAASVDLWGCDINVERHGLAVMRVQRSSGIVGGFCQMTSILQSGVFTSILERWPEQALAA